MQMDTAIETASQDYRGKRYIAYARCASPEGAAANLQDQIRRIRRFGDSLDMRCADEVRLAGVSGISPPFRDDLRRLLKRKRQRNDFDVLVMLDYARLTRTRCASGAEIEAEFAEMNVEIVFIDQWLQTVMRRPSHVRWGSISDLV
jgi:hypothetical protein